MTGGDPCLADTTLLSQALHGSAAIVVADYRHEVMISPRAVDMQRTPKITLAPETISY